MGDVNLPGIDWVQEQGKGRADEDFLDLVQDCFLTKFVDELILGRAVLDLLLSNDPNMVEEVEVGEHLVASDQQGRGHSISRLWTLRRHLIR